MIFKIVVLLNILWTDSVLDLVILSVFVLIILHFRVYMFIPILNHGFFSNHFHFLKEELNNKLKLTLVSLKSVYLIELLVNGLVDC